VLIVTDDFSIVAATDAADYWLKELLAMEKADGGNLPVSVRSVVTALKAIEGGQVSVNATPKVRLHMPSGHWLMLYASRLRGSGNQAQISVIFEMAQPAEIAPLMMQAYNLTKREGEVTQYVLRGSSTTEIAAALHISSNTVQDHLKAIFEKVDVGSRGELAARIFNQQYHSQFSAGAPLDASGQFIPPAK
jgi:DNA-binding NarL/FixJ family response regulator